MLIKIVTILNWPTTPYALSFKMTKQGVDVNKTFERATCSASIVDSFTVLVSRHALGRSFETSYSPKMGSATEVVYRTLQATPPRRTTWRQRRGRHRTTRPGRRTASCTSRLCRSVVVERGRPSASQNLMHGKIITPITVADTSMRLLTHAPETIF